MSTIKHLSLLLLVAAVAACGGKSSGGPDGGADSGVAEPDANAVCTGDVRGTSQIYYGTEAPIHVPLTPGQILAIGSLPGCSATLIAPTWVLTANHCGSSVGDSFCVGTEPANADQCMQVISVHRHPELDTALLELGVDARTRVPGIVPIPIATTPLGDSDLGSTAEAAGYGGQEDGSDGEREFTAEPIVALDASEITIDGEGARGACFGDSGGPLMVIAADASVRVAGDLSWGDQNCLGRDYYARVDLAVEWVETYTGPTLVGDGPYPCDSIDVQGRCMGAGSVAMWCGANGELETDSCAAGSACGWDASASGYRCITGDDPCGGVDEFGACEGGVARWCENGEAKTRDCGSCGEICAVAASSGGSHCAPDPCMGLDYLGQCDGDVAQWCQDGDLRQVDCAADGQTCGFVNDQVGWYCQRPA